MGSLFYLLNVKYGVFTFNDDTYIVTDSKHNAAPSFNKTHQNINTVGTEYQRIYNYFFPLTNSNICVLEAH